MRPVLIFARAPRLGGPKRRLAAGIGDEAALDFYRNTLFALPARLASFDLTFVVTPDESVADHSLWPAGVSRIAQGDGSLGDRMHRALQQVMPLPAVLIGSDIPEIRPAHLERAFDLLAAHDLVFGPAADGGFWLIGTRRRPLPERLFERVRWSSSHTLADTIATVPADWSVGLADELEDVDDALAHQRWLGREVP